MGSTWAGFRPGTRRRRAKGAAYERSVVPGMASTWQHNGGGLRHAEILRVRGPRKRIVGGLTMSSAPQIEGELTEPIRVYEAAV